MALHIEQVDKVPQDVEQAVSDGQQAYETRQGVVCDYTPFCLIARDASGALCGVLQGYSAFAEVYVEDLWVHEARRGQGIGRNLLSTLEERFAGQGFDNINLVTNAFQAVGFYQKCGFEIEYKRVHPTCPKLTKTFMIKRFPCSVPRTKGMV